MKSGFTLVELLIAAAIMSIIVMVTTNVLYDTVVSRSTHYAIAGSNQEIRTLIRDLSASVQAASRVSVPNDHTLSLSGTPCQTVSRDAGTQKLISAIDSSLGCVPPTAGFNNLTSDNLTVTSFTLSPISPNTDHLNLLITGTYTDGLGSHQFDYHTTINARTHP